MENEKLRLQEKEEKFTCLFCAMIYKTRLYSDREPFRDNFDKIWTECPRCKSITYKAIDKIMNGENNNE